MSINTAQHNNCEEQQEILMKSRISTYESLEALAPFPTPAGAGKSGIKKICRHVKQVLSPKKN